MRKLFQNLSLKCCLQPVHLLTLWLRPLFDYVSDEKRAAAFAPADGGPAFLCYSLFRNQTVVRYGIHAGSLCGEAEACVNEQGETACKY